MFPLGKLNHLNDMLSSLSARSVRQTYFVRINALNADIRGFLSRYIQLVQQNGVLLNGKIPNPSEDDLSYYNDKIGMEFEFSQAFIERSMDKWMPQLCPEQRGKLSRAIYDELEELHRKGKTEGILKNAFIKYSCWLYGKFGRVCAAVGTDEQPRILYIGQISRAELQMLNILRRVGCDVVLLYREEAEYLKIDADSAVSQRYCEANCVAIDENFSVKSLLLPPVRKDTAVLRQSPQDIRVAPQKILCANAWEKVSGKPMEDILVPACMRSNDPNMICTIFARICGVEDKLTYQSELRSFYQQLRSGKRQTLIIEDGIPTPTPEEAQSLRRRNYKSIEEMIADLRLNLSAGVNATLLNLMQNAFTEVLLEQSGEADMNLNRLTNIALHLLCWLKRYREKLFSGWQSPETACLIFMGGCKNEKESCFLKMVSRLPVDVLLLHPNLDEACALTSDTLMDVHFPYTLPVDRFPTEDVHMGTVAYHAERELDALMYQDTGLYRNRQFSRAQSIALRTTFEEITQLWDVDMKYRPNYSTLNGAVSLPVIYARICGVKNGATEPYWIQIKKLMTDQTKLISHLPYLSGREPNPIASAATEFLQRGRLNRDKIRNHRHYPFALLREETQSYILDKLQLMLDRKMIRGIGVNGAEYLVVSTVLNIGNDFRRMIQQFDFTKKNPKLLIINTRETLGTQEDAILITFLHLIGFDIAIFVPTGCQTIEHWLNANYPDEHQLGEYVYDLSVPDFNAISVKPRSLWNNIFRR